LIAHNGEINTVRGNRNWMRAREDMLASNVIPGDLDRLHPICTPLASDSASFDEVLELLHLGGRSLPHAVLMMIPEAWENNAEMDPERRAFYEFHATLMEAWDGPANVSFTDGDLIGAVLDRNGLRPGRFWVTSDGLVVLGSEAGVLDIDPATVIRKGRLQPGRMFLVDTTAGRVIETTRSRVRWPPPTLTATGYAGLIHLEELTDREHVVHTHSSVLRRQQTFGYTEEELRILLAPMASTGLEPIGSMGTDTPIAAFWSPAAAVRLLHPTVRSDQPPRYREEIVTSLYSNIGPEGNVLETTPAACRQVVLPFPVIDNDELAKILHINDDGDMAGFQAARVSALYRVESGGAGLAERIEQILAELDELIDGGVRFVVLSDRDSDFEWAPIPSLLLTSAVHHHLVRQKTRTQVSLLVEAGDVREVHHVALLIGYGAAAVNPYLAMESVEDLVASGYLTDIAPAAAMRNLVKALGKGVLKVMSKMGISTVSSYRGAQVFEAIGLGHELIDRYFTGTTSKLGGIGIEVVADEVASRHRRAYPESGTSSAHRKLEIGGEYQWRREGEPHLFDPETVFRLQHSARAQRYDIFKDYTS
jgi:glutamate synthase (NADPH/NADH) large chain